MTIKKATDEEIIKALRCCSEIITLCDACPFYNSVENCHAFGLKKNALDLIKRQKAEIERLRSMNQAKLDAIHDLRAQNEILSKNADTAFQDGLNECRELFEPEIKSEAYKEFARKLKCGVPQEHGAIRCSDVDNLVKEMVGEKE